jgi:hypothetical protein
MDYRIGRVLSSIIVLLWTFSTSGSSYSRELQYGREYAFIQFSHFGNYSKWGTDSIPNLGGLRNFEGNQSSGSTGNDKPKRPYRISKYISYIESVRTSHNVSNIPDDRQLSIMRNAGTKFFDPLRSYFNKPIHISSFFRSKELNTKVGGSPTSHHMVLGNICAIDIDQDGSPNGPTNLELFNHIKNNLEYYVLIWEFGINVPNWIHVAYSLNPEDNKKKNTYRASKINNVTVYTRI